MGCKSHFDAVVDIEPFRMVVHFLGQQGSARHERPSLAEIGKEVGLRYSFSSHEEVSE
jgi:hypothetical protein